MEQDNVAYSVSTTTPAKASVGLNIWKESKTKTNKRLSFCKDKYLPPFKNVYMNILPLTLA